MVSHTCKKKEEEEEQRKGMQNAGAKYVDCFEFSSDGSVALIVEGKKKPFVWVREY